ncbi:MAG: hypothetical protein VXZ92_00355, partial [SAR324 cluster bacterium]|nr:hypothetical protein [SAR324 cluster bacterium]
MASNSFFYWPTFCGSNSQKRKLTDIQCKSAKPSRDENGSTKPIKLSDGYGLNLEVRSDGKFWF